MVYSNTFKYHNFYSAKLLITTGIIIDPEVMEQKTEVLDLSNPEFECEILPDFPLPIESAVGAYINDRPIVCGGKDPFNEDFLNDKCFVLGQDEPIVELNSFRVGAAGISIANDVFWITGKPSTSASGTGMWTVTFRA